MRKPQEVKDYFNLTDEEEQKFSDEELKEIMERTEFDVTHVPLSKSIRRNKDRANDILNDKK